ncbi:hypothetical protein H6503_02040 [Candidatus Woesearchaeota archaeon]|nr:hypothetical protein [Candidatus Woesearchaeota archaeon]
MSRTQSNDILSFFVRQMTSESAFNKVSLKGIINAYSSRVVPTLGIETVTSIRVQADPSCNPGSCSNYFVYLSGLLKKDFSTLDLPVGDSISSYGILREDNVFIPTELANSTTCIVYGIKPYN